MNSWNFTGNLGRDCESRYTPEGICVVSFSVAVKSGWGDKAATTWPKCTIFGKRAESLIDFLKKGQQVAITGEVTNREWVDRDGAKRLSLEVRVENVTLIGRREGHNDSQNTGQSAQYNQVSNKPQKPTQHQPVNQYQQQTNGSGFEDMDDSIPF